MTSPLPPHARPEPTEDPLLAYLGRCSVAERLALNDAAARAALALRRAGASPSPPSPRDEGSGPQDR